MILIAPISMLKIGYYQKNQKKDIRKISRATLIKRYHHIHLNQATTTKKNSKDQDDGSKI